MKTYALCNSCLHVRHQGAFYKVESYMEYDFGCDTCGQKDMRMIQDELIIRLCQEILELKRKIKGSDE